MGDEYVFGQLDLDQPVSAEASCVGRHHLTLSVRGHGQAEGTHMRSVESCRVLLWGAMIWRVRHGVSRVMKDTAGYRSVC